MGLLTLVAGVCGLVEGLFGVVGSLFIFMCVDYPDMLIRDKPTANHTWTHLSGILKPEPVYNITPEQKVVLKPVTILAAGYSSDPNREMIFCFAITCGVFSVIWILSSILIIPGTTLKSARLLWMWVLCTSACAFVDFMAALFFAAKTGGYIRSFEHPVDSILSDSTVLFMKYNYPLFLLFVLGRGVITVPINMLLAGLIHKAAENYCRLRTELSIPHSVLAHSPTFLYPVKNGGLDPGPSNGLPSSAVYTNESFTHDEKF